MAKKIAIVTDSNAGISLEEAKKLGVIVIPMPFFAEGKTYFEEISLSQDQFYDMLARDVSVSTSQPAIGEVTDLWDKLLKEYDEIVEIPMSSGLSMTYETASSFSSEKPYEGKVFIINNCRISVTQAQSVIDALNLVKKGYSGAEIKKILEDDAFNASIYITVDTLKYLKKGGRVTPAGAALGAFLGIKPVLTIQGAKLDAFAKPRGMKAAKRIMLDAISKDIKERFGGEENCHLEVAYTHNREEAEKFLEEVKTLFPKAIDYVISPLSLSVSCHIGPGSLAIAATKDLKID